MTSDPMSDRGNVWAKRARFIAPLVASVALVLCAIISFDCRSLEVHVMSNESRIKNGTTFFYAGMFTYEDFKVVDTSLGDCEKFPHSLLCQNNKIVRVERQGTCKLYPSYMTIDGDWEIAQLACIIVLLFGGLLTASLWVVTIFECTSFFVDYVIAFLFMLILPTGQGLTFWIRGSSSLCSVPGPLFDPNVYKNGSLLCGDYRHFYINICCIVLWGVAGCLVAQFANLELKTIVSLIDWEDATEAISEPSEADLDLEDFMKPTIAESVEDSADISNSRNISEMSSEVSRHAPDRRENSDEILDEKAAQASEINTTSQEDQDQTSEGLCSKV